jgi:hypothetical protein
MTATIKTGSWFNPLPDGHKRIGISRGIPRRTPAGYRIYKTLAPGPWFNSVGIDEYHHLYRTEILGPLDPRTVVSALNELAGGLIPVVLCYERPGTGDWCHRAMVAEWLAEALGVVVPEVGHEHLPQHEHPLMPLQLRRVIATAMIEPCDVGPYIGRSAIIGGELHQVVEADPDKPGQAIITAGGRRYSTGGDSLRRYFSA